MTTSKIATGRVTIYSMSEFGLGYRKVEAVSAEVVVRPYGGHERAVEVTFRAPRQKRDRVILETGRASVLVLEGWGHPDPAACDGAVSADIRPAFSAMVDGHIARTGARVVADYRRHETR